MTHCATPHTRLTPAHPLRSHSHPPLSLHACLLLLLRRRAHTANRCICALAPIHRAGPLQAAGTHVLSTLHPELLTAPHSTSAANHHHAAPPPPLPGASAGGFLGVVELVTLCMVHVGGVNASGASCADEGDDRYWQQECLDMLLEVRAMGGGL